MKSRTFCGSIPDNAASFADTFVCGAGLHRLKHTVPRDTVSATRKPNAIVYRGSTGFAVTVVSP